MRDRSLTMIGETLASQATRPYEAAWSMPGAFYSDPEVLAIEREQLFAREWICVGRIEEVARPGDYITFEILEEPVVIVHGRDGEIRALSNVCRHRGTKIAKGSGNARTLVCPYHHWTYDLAGGLLAAPHMEDRSDFGIANCRLPELRCELWQGFVFVSLDPDAPALAPRLAGLEEITRNYHFEEMKLRYLADEAWDTNWKCLVENFMEGYHLSALHRKTLHNVTPTNLCRHFEPGEDYFGYYVGFSARLPDSAVGHPDLSEAQLDDCVMYAVPPGLVVGGASDYSSFVCIQPETVGRVRIKLGLIFYGDDWRDEKVDEAVALFQDTMAEDKTILVDLQRGLAARHHSVGPLAPSGMEGPILDFYRYLNRKIGPALTSGASLP